MHVYSMISEKCTCTCTMHVYGVLSEKCTCTCIMHVYGVISEKCTCSPLQAASSVPCVGGLLNVQPGKSLDFFVYI